MSPLLFITLMDEIAKECREHTRGITIGLRHLKKVNISELIYADDLVIVANKESDLQRNVEVWVGKFDKYGMNVNIKKTETMMVSKRDEGPVNILIKGETVNQTTDFRYLGTVLNSQGDYEPDINNRINNANKLYHAINWPFIRKKEVSLETKIKIFNSVYVPVLIYGCEAWTLNDRLKSRIQASEMKYLRATIGVTRRDRIRNEYIRERVKVTPILDKIEQRQLGWFGHLTRMTNTRGVKQIWTAGDDTKRKRGRPTRTWNDGVAKALKKRGLSWQEGTILAQNREGWKNCCMTTSTP